MGNNKFSIASVGNRRAFRDGARDGVPIALGYFAVSFSLGIVARNVGMTPIQGRITSSTLQRVRRGIRGLYDDRRGGSVY